MKSILYVAIVAFLSLFTQGCAYDQVNRYSYEYGQEKGLSAEAQLHLDQIQNEFEKLNRRYRDANAVAECRRRQVIHALSERDTPVDSVSSSVELDPAYATWNQERNDSAAGILALGQDVKTYVAQLSTADLKALHRWLDSWEARDGWFTKFLRTIV